MGLKTCIQSVVDVADVVEAVFLDTGLRWCDESFSHRLQSPTRHGAARRLFNSLRG